MNRADEEPTHSGGVVLRACIESLGLTITDASLKYSAALVMRRNLIVEFQRCKFA